MPTKIACGLLAAAAALSIGLALAADGIGLSDYRKLLFMWGSTTYVLIALVGGALKSRYGQLLLVALVFFWHGDLLGPTSFRAGVWAFLLGHIALLAAFAVRGLSVRRCVMTAVALVPVSAAICLWLLPHVPRDDVPLVVAYMAVISAMLMLAGGAVDGPSRRLVLVAAVIFYVSDVFVARWRFVDPSSVNALFCYPLYYTACMLFAYSAAPEREA